MTWTAPRTWVAGEVVTAAELNTHVRDDLLAVNPTPSATPPASPVDGDHWIYDGGAYYWHFLHDSSDGTYPWKFIGGPPLANWSATSRNTVGGSALPWADPLVTVPRSGVYDLTWYVDAGTAGNVSTPTTIQWYSICIDTSNGNALVGNYSHVYFYAAASGIPYYWPMAVANQEVALTAAHVLGIQSHATGWDITSQSRSLGIVPIRVA